MIFQTTFQEKLYVEKMNININVFNKRPPLINYRYRDLYSFLPQIEHNDASLYKRISGP